MSSAREYHYRSGKKRISGGIAGEYILYKKAFQFTFRQYIHRSGDVLHFFYIKSMFVKQIDNPFAGINPGIGKAFIKRSGQP